MDEVQRVYSGAPWERRVGYCRALRRGPMVVVTGTAPVAEDGTTFAPGDAQAQAAHCLALIESALVGLGCDRRHIMRTRMFVTDITRWEEFGRAHAEFFGQEHPATTMVEVSRLIGPQMLIEIEADAWDPSGGL